MALLGRDGGIRSANAALCRLTGHSREALDAAQIQRIMGPDERSGLDATLLQLGAAEHTSVRSERSLLCADGRVRRVSLTISAVDNREEQPVELVAHLLDLGRSPETPEELARLTDPGPLTGPRPRAVSG